MRLRTWLLNGFFLISGAVSGVGVGHLTLAKKPNLLFFEDPQKIRTTSSDGGAVNRLTMM